MLLLKNVKALLEIEPTAPQIDKFDFCLEVEKTFGKFESKVIGRERAYEGVIDIVMSSRDTVSENSTTSQTG